MGGLAFINTSPVPRNISKEIIDFIITNIGIGVVPVGSTLKKQISGDIDLAVSDKEYSYSDISTRLFACRKVVDIKCRQNLNQIYTKFTWDGKNYQVDFMFGNLDWLLFSYWSPDPEESKLGGAYRTELLAAIVSSRQDVIKCDDQIIARYGPVFYHDLGIKTVAKSRKRKRLGDFFKTENKIPFREYKKLRYEYKKKTIISKSVFFTTNIPNDLCNYLYSGTSINNFVTYEKIMDMVLSDKKKSLILDIFKIRAKKRGLVVEDL